MKKTAVRILSVALSGLALSASLTACSGKDQAAAMAGAQSAPEIAVQTVSTEDSELAKTFPATIKGKTDIAIRPQVTGFITKVHVDEGQRVHKGQVLFTLDQVQFQAAVDQAEAAVNSARTALNTAQITEQNKKMLLDKNIISEYEWQMAANSLAQAKAQLAQAQAGLVTARKNLAYTVVTAPSDGVVGTIPNREGSLASPSSALPLTTVSDNSEVYAYFSLTEKDLLDLNEKGGIEAGIKSMPAVNLILADGTVYPIQGKVATVSGVIENTTGAASVRALFDNPQGLLRSGSTGLVSLPIINKDVIVIPQKATFEVQDKRFVYTLNDSNMTVTTPVEVQSISDGKNFVVLSGLKPGDRVVTEGVGTRVREGMPVKPVDAKAAQAAQAAPAPAAE
ncbi:MAG: efflux RND transporter periplasmic adaptor subunit [Muribaculaceae bacterium]|nr:efflux RND transporter periplasmic adaptor subunit [Muribaculaceae bacterium]